MGSQARQQPGPRQPPPQAVGEASWGSVHTQDLTPKCEQPRPSTPKQEAWVGGIFFFFNFFTPIFVKSCLGFYPGPPKGEPWSFTA